MARRPYWPRLVALVLLLLVCACQAAILRPLDWGSIPNYHAIPAPEVLETEPHGLVVGDPVPFDGFLVATEDWHRLVHEYERLQEALRLNQEGRGGDRASCDQYVQNLQGEVVRLKADRPRICGLCAAGASGLAIGLTGAVAAEACD